MSRTRWFKHTFPPYVSGRERYLPYKGDVPMITYALQKTEHGIIGTGKMDEGTVIIYEDENARIQYQYDVSDLKGI